jgi:hypothetical protein
MLPPDLEVTWQRYLEEEKNGVRTEALRLLDRFVGALLTQAPSLRRSWAMHIAATIVDEGIDLPVRFPLFRRVLLPVLVDGVNRHESGCARWLAAFESMLYHSLPTGLSPELESRTGLLREAIRLDPSDKRALEQLIASEASYLDYTLHELPTGVLYGRNGATLEQCEKLLDGLGEFESHIHQSGQTYQYQELVNECRLHYQAYRQYLTTNREEASYEQYFQTYSPVTNETA